jgi:hypothetical protein
MHTFFCSHPAALGCLLNSSIIARAWYLSAAVSVAEQQQQTVLQVTSCYMLLTLLLLLLLLLCYVLFATA